MKKGGASSTADRPPSVASLRSPCTDRRVHDEVFWLTGRDSWVPATNPIDIEQPDEAVLAEVDELWNRVRHVLVGGVMTEEPATLEIGR
jgi:hypothetical protein